MSLTVTDPAFAAALASTETPVQLRGPDGKVMGVYLPIIPGMSIPESGMTDDELRRLLDDPNGWVTADEVHARLRELEGKV
jgi:hypothetical protein